MTEATNIGSFLAWAELLRDTSRAGSEDQQAALLKKWFEGASDEDRFSAIQLLAGEAPKKLVTKKALVQLHADRSPLPEWLRQECHAAAPDPCEAIALMEDAGQRGGGIGLIDIITLLQNASRFTTEQKTAIISQQWDVLDSESMYLFNRLATGSQTVNMPRSVWISVVAVQLGIPMHILAHRLEEKNWVGAGYPALARQQHEAGIIPLPFPRVRTIQEYQDGALEGLSATWSHAGPEVQLIKRGGRALVWGRGLDDRFDDLDELISSADCLPDGTVLYGQLADSDGPKGGTQLHLLDVWEWDGQVPDPPDPAGRKALVRNLLTAQTGLPIRIADDLTITDVAAAKDMHRKCRLHRANGLLLLPNNFRGPEPMESLLWLAAPHRILAVLLYVQRGDGRQGPQYSFGLANGRDWVTIARTGEGLDQEERDAIDAFTKANTLQRFGPVRTVKAIQVMELAVDTIRASTRHKSGYLLEGVRIVAWRKDLGTEMVDDMSMLNSMKEE